MRWSPPTLPSLAPWHKALSAACALSGGSAVLAFIYAPPWYLWCIFGVVLGASLYALDEHASPLERQKPLPHFAMTGLKLLCATLTITGLSLVQPAFASLFIALPLVATRLVYPKTRRLWLHASALASLALWVTPIPAATVVSITILAVVSSFWATQTSSERVFAAFAPENPSRPGRGLALETGGTHAVEESAVELTLETIHRLVGTTRAATRSRFAGTLWLSADLREGRIGIAETATNAPLHESALPAESFFGDLNPATCGVVEIQRDEPAPWYQDNAPTDARILIAPILDEGIPVGALIVERALDSGEFSRADIAVLENAAAVIAQALRTERALIQAARTGQDLKLVARAADLLRDALTRADVFEIAQALFEELLGEPSLAIIECEENDALRVAYAIGGWTEKLLQKEIPVDASLIGLAIRRRHALPYRAGGEAGDPALFGPVYRPTGDDSRLICPMVSGGKAIGAIVIRLERPDQFTPLVRERMVLVTNQLAAALANALAYESMVVRATTDGMTRLLNHATFRERYVQAVDRAGRNGRSLSVLLLDIDHFKSVNDTYGHGVGDDVIRGVADVIRSQARKVDLAARYGGEEFCVVLEDTGPEGAMHFGERLRAMVEKLQFRGNNTNFRVTISVGICVFPDHGDDAQAIIEHADAALYVSKRAGRNRVSIWTPPRLEELVA